MASEENAREQIDCDLIELKRRTYSLKKLVEATIPHEEHRAGILVRLSEVFVALEQTQEEVRRKM